MGKKSQNWIKEVSTLEVSTKHSKKKKKELKKDLLCGICQFFPKTFLIKRRSPNFANINNKKVSYKVLYIRMPGDSASTLKTRK